MSILVGEHGNGNSVAVLFFARKLPCLQTKIVILMTTKVDIEMFAIVIPPNERSLIIITFFVVECT